METEIFIEWFSQLFILVLKWEYKNISHDSEKF